jgi:hypothetical protein
VAVSCLRENDAQPFGQADELRAAPSARGLPHTLGPTISPHERCQRSYLVACFALCPECIHAIASVATLVLGRTGFVASESCNTRTFTVCVGCPSFGGQRMVVVLPRRQLTRMSKPHGHASCTRKTAGQSAAGASRSAQLRQESKSNAKSIFRSSTCGETLLSSQHAKPAVLGASPMHGVATEQAVWPNPSVKPTCSGLRPPRAAYLKR